MNDYIYILKRAFKCGIGVLVFLALVQPFGIGRLNEGRMGYILICSLISFLAVLFSLLLTKAALGDYEKRNGSLKYFLVRESVAYIVNTPILALLLLMYDGWFCQRRWDMFFYEDGHFTLYNVWLMCVNVGIVTVFMFLWAFYEFRNDQLRRELDDVKMANYADICYISENETRHITLRITLKQIKETLSEFGYIVQCHRAFLVNINFVVSMTARNPGYQLQLFGVEKQLPVSRANNDVIKSVLSDK